MNLNLPPQNLLTILIDDTNSYKTHNALSIFVTLLLGVCVLGVTIASIFMNKSLSTELLTLVTGITGLAGYQYAKGQPPPFPLKTSPPSINSSSNSTNEENVGEG